MAEKKLYTTRLSQAQAERDQAIAEKNSRPTRAGTALAVLGTSAAGIALALSLSGGFNGKPTSPVVAKSAEATRSPVTADKAGNSAPLVATLTEATVTPRLTTTPTKALEAIPTSTPSPKATETLVATVNPTVAPKATEAPNPTKAPAIEVSKVQTGTEAEFGKPVIKEVISKTVENGWNVTYYNGATEQMMGQGPNPWKKLEAINLDVKQWPNVSQTVAGKIYSPANGLEYGQDIDSYMQTSRGNFVVPAGEYRVYTGDYNLGALGQHTSTVGGEGGAIMFINVGNVTANFRDVMADSGFTIRGRYFNGDTLKEAAMLAMSKTANNMLHRESKLNPSALQNAGANCSSRTGCGSVELNIFFISGNQVLLTAKTVVARN